MSAPLPSESEIRARAEELKLIQPGADLPSRVRSKVAAILHHEATAALNAPPPGMQDVLLSRTTLETDAGSIRIDVILTPKGTS